MSECTDPSCVDGKISVDQGEGLANCPTCRPTKAETEMSEKLSERFKSYVYSTHTVFLSTSELFRYADEIAALEQRLEAAEAENKLLHDRHSFDADYVKQIEDYVRSESSETTLEAIKRREQQAIDAALESAVDYLRERGRTCNRESTASIKRANGNITIYSDNLSKEANKLFHYANDLESKFKGTNPLAEAQARIAELERENTMLKTVPMKYRRMGFNAVLQDKVEKLERELDDAKRRLAMMQP